MVISSNEIKKKKDCTLNKDSKNCGLAPVVLCVVALVVAFVLFDDKSIISSGGIVVSSSSFMPIGN